MCHRETIGTYFRGWRKGSWRKDYGKNTRTERETRASQREANALKERKKEKERVKGKTEARMRKSAESSTRVGDRPG